MLPTAHALSVSLTHAHTGMQSLIHTHKLDLQDGSIKKHVKCLTTQDIILLIVKVIPKCIKTITDQSAAKSICTMWVLIWSIENKLMCRTSRHVNEMIERNKNIYEHCLKYLRLFQLYRNMNETRWLINTCNTLCSYTCIRKHLSTATELLFYTNDVELWKPRWLACFTVKQVVIESFHSETE